MRIAKIDARCGSLPQERPAEQAPAKIKNLHFAPILPAYLFGGAKAIRTLAIDANDPPFGIASATNMQFCRASPDGYKK